MKIDCQYCEILDYLPLGVFIVDAEYRIMFWNKWLCDKTGIAKEMAQGKKLEQAFPDFDSPRYNWALEQAITRKSSQVLSQALNRYLLPIKNPPMGRHGIAYMQQQVTINPLETDKGEAWAIITIQDVTENVMRSSALTEMAQKLEQDSNHDSMTGVYNRRFMWEWLITQFKQSIRYRYPIACLMFDIDHFKDMNDTHGHQRGDQVLKEFSELMCRTLRDSDIVIRYGGEEFIALLPHCDLGGGILTGWRILKLMRDTVFDELESGAVTCSIGVSAYIPEDPCSGEELLKAADRRLYEAKNSGRNQVIPAKGECLYRSSVNADNQVAKNVRKLPTK